MNSTVPEGVLHEDMPPIPRGTDPVIAGMIHTMGELKSTVAALEQRLPTPEQWAALNALLLEQQESNKFWKEVRQSVIKKAVIYGLGFVGAAIIYFIYSGKPPTLGG